MTALQDDISVFEDSYRKYLKWPSNLINAELYRPLLHAAQQRLEKTDDLFDTTEEPIIYIRDFQSDLGVFDKDKICRNPDLFKDSDPDDKLKAYLGDLSVWNPQYARMEGRCMTKADPKCRFVFLVSGNTRKALFVSEPMFKRLMTYHQVSHTFVDYITVFGGGGDRPRDLRFGGFSEQTSFSPQGRAGRLTIAGRSGREYQMCYNLKAPALHRNGTWSVRQAAIHHQLDIHNGRTLWIMAKGDDLLKQNVERLTGSNGTRDAKNFSDSQAAFRASFAVHLMLALWSSENWRGYIAYFEDRVERETGAAVNVPQDQQTKKIIYRPKHLQDAQYSQDKVKEAIVVMKLNIDVLQSLLEYLKHVLEHPESSLDDLESRTQFDIFTKRVTNMIESLNLHISRADLMSSLIDDRKELIIQHMQAQTTDNMGRLARYAGADTIAMRIITIVTLIFLPATFVSTFFSTDVVKYQQGDGDGPPNRGSMTSANFSLLALERWLEVTLPLTLITVIVAAYFYRRAMNLRQLGALDLEKGRRPWSRIKDRMTK